MPLFNTWVLKNASASGGKPPDPSCYNIFPDICWRSPFRVKGYNYKCLPLNTQIYKKCFSFRVKGCKCPPFNMYGFTQMLKLFTSEELDLMPLKGKRPQIYFFEHWQKCCNNAWFNVFRLGKLFKLKIGWLGKDFKLLRTIYTPAYCI